MMRALPLEVLVSLPSLIKGLSIPLNEGHDLCPQLRSLAQWKILAEKSLGKHVPGGEGIRLCILQSIAGSIPQ